MRVAPLRRGQPPTHAATLAPGLMVEGAAQSWVVSGFEPFERPLELQRVCRQIPDIWCRAIYIDTIELQPAC